MFSLWYQVWLCSEPKSYFQSDMVLPCNNWAVFVHFRTGRRDWKRSLIAYCLLLWVQLSDEVDMRIWIRSSSRIMSCLRMQSGRRGWWKWGQWGHESIVQIYCTGFDQNYVNICTGLSSPLIAVIKAWTEGLGFYLVVHLFRNWRC